MEKLNNRSEFSLIFKYALKDLSRNYHKISSIIVTLFKIINGFFLSSLAICKKGKVAIKSKGLGWTGTNTAFEDFTI